MLQHTTATSSEGSTTRRSPSRSSSRPRQGPLTAMATVAAAASAPAAAYECPRVVTTCTVMSTPLANTGPRTSVPSTRMVRNRRLASARR